MEMIICRHFRLTQEVISGCNAGRIAYYDCGPGCAVYDPDGAPSRRSDRELEAWNGADDMKETVLKNISDKI
jgi:hypothetical protein